jgi:hypothetical protein
MKSCKIVTKDTLRHEPSEATIKVGGGWFFPHPGWGFAAASLANLDTPVEGMSGHVAVFRAELRARPVAVHT